MHFNCRGRNKRCYNFIVHLPKLLLLFKVVLLILIVPVQTAIIPLLQLYTVPTTRDIVDSLQKKILRGLPVLFCIDDRV